MNRLEKAQEICGRHYLVDPKMRSALYFPGGDLIRLLEISDDVPYMDCVWALPHPEESFELILMCPQDYDSYREGRLTLPEGWSKEPVEIRSTNGHR